MKDSENILIKAQHLLSVTETCFNKDQYLVKSNKNLTFWSLFFSHLSEGLFFKKKKKHFSFNKVVYRRTQDAPSLFHPANPHRFEQTSHAPQSQQPVEFITLEVKERTASMAEKLHRQAARRRLILHLVWQQERRFIEQVGKMHLDR